MELKGKQYDDRSNLFSSELLFQGFRKWVVCPADIF